MINELKASCSRYVGMKKWCSFLFIMFVGLFFVDGITRYKHLVFYCAIITSLFIIYNEKQIVKELIKNNIFRFLVLLFIVGVYSSSISIDNSMSFKYFFNTIAEKTVLAPIAFALVISQLPHRQICQSLLIGLGLMFLVSGGKEFYSYYVEYRQGIYPFSNYNHRFIAEALIFSLPCILLLWKTKGLKAKVCFIVVAGLYGFLMLGLLQRGAWLAILVFSLLWCLFNREWKLPLLVTLIVAVSSVGIFMKFHDRLSVLTYKLEQTSSSHRFGNGTQGAAWDMIMQHPVKGSGIGDKVYLKAYANNLPQYPQWFFREPVGPHNFFLSSWFAGGVLGLLVSVSVVLVVLVTAFKGYRRSENMIRYCYSSVFLMMFADFFVRGWVEETFIFQTAIASAFLMGMFLSARRIMQLKH
ncbi:O-antigen ligase [Rosenbergiella nectarea]|uniref:O-antigen ligase n=1 Tax=Rosenbergiella nectarea TaxID=988801 RepID=A0A1H9L114_9GAMM|nr:O-antigen ligase RfaL [Rosenbergiella nectarea]SER05086.1 O-antigen ligase [Rosenbergiella nectarea]